MSITAPGPPKWPGRLVENRAVEGQALRTGEPLARVDPGDYELQIHRAKSSGWPRYYRVDHRAKCAAACNA